MEIAEAILHEIEKRQHTTEAELNTREATLGHTKPLERLAGDVHSRYANHYNMQGSFGSDPDLHRFPVMLDEYLDETIDIIEFSKRAGGLIRAEMAKSQFATGGFIKFLRYANQGKDWLLILMLKTKAKTGIDLDTLDLNESYVFDIEHLHEAARLDVEKWRNKDTPYLSFVKPRPGKDDPSKFFRDALNCTDFTHPKHNTKQMLEALENYTSAMGWDEEQTRQARKAVYDYCQEKKHAGDPVNLTSLSSRINDQDPGSFRDHVKANDYEVADIFTPHPNTYKRLHRLARKFASINVSFDVAQLMDDTVSVRHEEGKPALVIKNVPEEFVNEIKRAQGQDETADGTV